MSQLKLNATIRALINPTVLKSDTDRVNKCLFDSTFAQAIVDTIGALVTPDEVGQMMQKGRVHTARVGRWIASSGLDLSKFDRASAFCAAVICDSSAPRIAYADLHYVCGGSINSPVSIPGVSRAKLRAVIKGYTTNMGTISTQVSRTVGAGGLFTAMGIVSKKDSHGFSVNPNGREHPFLKAYAITLNSLSERTLIELMEKGDK